MCEDFDVKKQGMDFFTGKSFIMDYRLVFWPEATVKTPWRWICLFIYFLNAALYNFILLFTSRC